jgi:hypothetical protein
VRLEELDKLKKKSNDLIGNRTRDLLAFSIVPQPTILFRASIFIIYECEMLPLLISRLLDLLFVHENGGSVLLRNVGNFTVVHVVASQAIVLSIVTSVRIPNASYSCRTRCSRRRFATESGSCEHDAKQ